MDTRRMPGSTDTFTWPSFGTVTEDVEIVEVRHIERPIRSLASRALFVAFIALLVATIAVAGMPDRSDWYIKTPLPNLFSFDITF
jgi:hypothetical protein